MMMFAALGQTLLFNATMGRNPVGLKIGIVSDELANFEECNNQFLVTTNLTIVDDEELCLLDKISCRFISEISSEIGVKKIYGSFEDGIGDIESGNTIALVYFVSNFSYSTQRFFEGLVGEDEDVIDDILDSKEIKIHIDRTDFHSSNFIEKKLYDVYEIFIKSIAKSCNLVDTKYDLNFMSFEKPIYGESDINIRNHMGPMAMLMFFYFGMLANTITTFIDDRKTGCWNRTFLSGISSLEYLFCHAFVHIIIAMFQLILTIWMLFYLYPHSQETEHVWLIVMLFALAGICGLSFGIALGCSFERLENCAQFSNFICDGMFKVSGEIKSTRSI